MASPQVVTGQSSGPLDAVVRHLWTPLIESGHSRVVVGPSSDATWSALRTFRLQPTARHPRLLVSTGPRQGLGRALAAYGRLRSSRARIGRLLIAGGARSGVFLPRPVLTVESRDPEVAGGLEPVSRMESILGSDLLALIGVRDTANGKATLQLFDYEGRPAAYAKLAWNVLTARSIRTEAEALRQTTLGRHDVRVPRLVAEGDIGGLPFFLTEPLPASVRRVRRGTGLSAHDVTTLFPVTRAAQIRETGQFQGVLQRLDPLIAAGTDEDLGRATRALVAGLEAWTGRLPVMQRWHGDLVPWNAAVDDAGTLWLWDWESSAADAVAGLDVLHWVINRDGPAPPDSLGSRLQTGLTEAAPALHQLGMDDDACQVALAAYVLAFVERNWTLAVANGGWDRHRVGRGPTLNLVRSGLAQLEGLRQTHRGQG